jgi:Rrf2 family protein
LRYLEQLIAPLTAAGLVRSMRGARGGIWLARPPEEIRLSEVIQLLEGSLAPAECVDDPEVCDRSATCVTRDVWGELKDAMEAVLESITLQDLVERHRAKAPPERAMYYL